MKNNSIELLSDLSKLEQRAKTGDQSFPTSQQIQNYQQVSYKLRSMVFAKLLNMFSRYFLSQCSKFTSFWQQRKAVAELEQLDTFMLKDIGLTRADIESLRYGSTTVEELNERRSNTNKDRFSINSLEDLHICKCNQKVVAVNSTMAKCG